jgi:hypothetical protein
VLYYFLFISWEGKSQFLKLPLGLGHHEISFHAGQGTNVRVVPLRYVCLLQLYIQSQWGWGEHGYIVSWTWAMAPVVYLTSTALTLIRSDVSSEIVSNR